jgi:hypothetical protein
MAYREEALAMFTRIIKSIDNDNSPEYDPNKTASKK